MPPRMPSVPVVVLPLPLVEVVPGVVPVPVPVLLLSPMTLTALPPIATGAVTSGAICVPPATESSPDVVPAVPAPVVGAVPPTGAEPVELLSPRRLTALPPIVTGTETPATICVPPRTASSPVVAGPDETGADVTGTEGSGVVPPALELSPSSERPLPEIETGRTTSTRACEPPPIESLPEVVAGAVVGAGAAGAGAAGAAGEVAVSPTTEIAVSVTVTGTSTETIPCVPESRPESPLVVVTGAGAAGAAGAGAGAGAAVGAAGAGAGAAAAGAGAGAAAGAVATLSPSTETALPSADTGASTTAPTWVPESSPSSPVVVGAAWAAVVPRAQMPPTKSAPVSPLETYLFMTSSR